LLDISLISLTKNHQSPNNISDLSIGKAIKLLKPVLQDGITRTGVSKHSTDDISLQNTFDVWYTSTVWKPPVADRASKKFKDVT
jgi:hypothetical protein